MLTDIVKFIIDSYKYFLLVFIKVRLGLLQAFIFRGLNSISFFITGILFYKCIILVSKKRLLPLLC